MAKKKASLDDLVQVYQQKLRWAGFEVTQQGVVNAYTGVLLWPLQDYLARLEVGPAGILNELCKLDVEYQ